MVYPSRLGPYDQAMILTQYLINNGLDNLWVSNGNSDTPSTNNITTTDPNGGTLDTMTLSSPRVIIQPDSDPQGTTGQQVIIFVVRVESGTFRSKPNPFYQQGRVFDMTNWKLAYKATIDSIQIDPAALSPQAQKYVAKLPTYTSGYSIKQLNLTIQGLSASAGAQVSIVPAFSEFGQITPDYLTMQNFGILMNTTLRNLVTQNMLVVGYNAKPNDPATVTDHPPTFLQTGRRLQQYPWIDASPLNQPSYGAQGNTRLNALCFLEKTNSSTMPTGGASVLPYTKNFTNVQPQSLYPTVPLMRSGWKVTCDVSEPGFDPSRIVDGNASSFWHSAFTPKPAPLPHTITVDTNSYGTIWGLAYLPRQDGTLNGTIGQYSIDTSIDGISWTPAVDHKAWNNDASLKFGNFAPRLARMVRLTAWAECQSATNQWTTASEINLLGRGPVDRTQWYVKATSTGAGEQMEPGNEATKAIDGNETSLWHSLWSSNPVGTYPHRFSIVRGGGKDPLGQYLLKRSVLSRTVNFEILPKVCGLVYVPRRDATPNGRIGAYRIEAADTTINVQTPSIGVTGGSSSSTPYSYATKILAQGTWTDDSTPKVVMFPPTSSFKIDLVALSEAGNRGVYVSASEIYSLDGTTPPAADTSSSDFGSFVVSRESFFERYFLPKLRVLNAALESHCQTPAISLTQGTGIEDFIYSYERWSILDLGIGPPTISQPQPPSSNPFYDFKPDTSASIPTWKWSSNYGGSAPSTTLNLSKMTASGTANTSTTLSFNPGGNRLTLTGTTKVNLSTNVSASSFPSNTLNFSLNWTILFDLVAVSDGGLAINMTTSAPQPSLDGTSTLDLLNVYPDYLKTCLANALTRFGNLENQLQQDLSGQQRFYFPAAGSFFFKNPTFNEYGDLVCGVSYNGNIDDARPNSNAADRIAYISPGSAIPAPPGFGDRVVSSK